MKIIGLKFVYKVFTALIILSSTLTHSQETSFFQEETTIKYEKLNEFSKYVNYKTLIDERVALLEREIMVKDSIINSQRVALDLYEKSILPNLNARIESLKAQERLNSEIVGLRDLEWQGRLQREKDKKVGVGVIVGVNYDGSFTAGIGVSYSFLRL